VEVRARNPEGRPIGASATLAVRMPAREGAYAMPVRGTWYMRSAPSLASHHRWRAATEFAVDFFKVDGDGRIRDGDPADAESYYGSGEGVLAAADGTVVAVEDSPVQNRGVRIRRPDESAEAFGRRAQRHLFGELEKNYRTALAGNYVTIRHADGMYSTYGHLKTGSAQVEVGVSVVQGQPIAAVGDTGDSNAVHLHFQLNEGSDPFLSRSVPVTFGDMQPPFDESGRFVHAAPRPAE
jgi:hypothetical protein